MPRRLGTPFAERLLALVSVALGAAGCTGAGLEASDLDAEGEAGGRAEERAAAAPRVAGAEPPWTPEQSPEDPVPRFNYADDYLAICRQGSLSMIQGDLHSHTHHSDGHYDPHTAFSITRACGMDFLAVTDHVRATGTMTDAEWDECRGDANDANVDGSYLAMCGFEVEPDRGHANVFFTPDIWTASGPYPERPDFASKLNNSAYNGLGVSGQINHPCILDEDGDPNYDNRWGQFPYNVAIDDNMSLMEFSGSGSLACKQNEYTYLLDTGWHLAPSSNGDRHGTDQDWCASPRWRTGFWVSEFTRAGLQDAMRHRRSFAAPHGSSIQLLADGCWMGSVVGGVGTASFFVDAFHGGGLSSIDLVGNGGAVRHTHGCGNAATCSFSVDLSVGAGSYVFAYAYRSDDLERPLVAAPVWFRATPTCSGECTPGTVESAGCGNCGTQTRRCLGSCAWSPWSGCIGSGPCSGDQIETAPCNDCGTHSRQCQPGCTWADWSPCVGSGQVETIGCGNCGQMTVVCDANGAATPQTGCMNSGPCAPGQSESSACCDCGTTTRSCEANCQWSTWSGCAGLDPAGGTEPCGTGIGGVCEEGRRRCVEGCLACVSVAPTEPERCDGIDNDCANGPDDGFPTELASPPPAWAATLVDASAPLSLSANERASVWAQFRNVGTEPWAAGGVWLVPESAPEVSPLWDERSWPAYDTAAVLARPVAPGTVATFAFDVQLAAASEVAATERFRLISAPDLALRCPSPYVDIAVRRAHDQDSQDVLMPLTTTDEPSGCGCRQAGWRSPHGWLALGALTPLLPMARRKHARRGPSQR